ncbi:hypothetical protein [Streptomyces sp. NPDC048720]|uniref:hypothetical protein n=1 Tax=Streptomyces sp. NPDC048720 TaxID=3365588 RepID=UPI003719715E
MNSEMALEMMQALKEGKTFNFEVKACEGNYTELRVHLGQKSMALYDADGEFAFKVNDPKVAQGLAGALVWWAFQQQGKKPTGEEMAACMELFGWADKAFGYHDVNESRAKWYERNIPIMTLETLQRNLRDLKLIGARAQAQNDNATFNDVVKAIGYLQHAIREKEAKPELKKCEDTLCERTENPNAAFNFKGFCCARCQTHRGHSISCDKRNEGK